MATVKGSEGLVKVGAVTIAEIRSYSYDESADTIETTSMGDTARSYVPSLTSWTGSIEVLWDPADTTGQGALTIGSSVSVSFYKEGETTGDLYASGTAIITGISNSGSYDDLVMKSYTLQGDGVLVETAVV